MRWAAGGVAGVAGVAEDDSSEEGRGAMTFAGADQDADYGAAPMVAQCGPDLLVLEPEVDRLRLARVPARELRQADGPAPRMRAQEVHCFPEIPLPDGGLVALQANAAQDKVLVAAEHGVVVVRLPAAQRALSQQQQQGGVMEGTMEADGPDERVWLVKLDAPARDGLKLQFESTLDSELGEWTGTITGAEGFQHGEFSLKRDSVTQSLALKANYSGSCRLVQPGYAPFESTLSVIIDKLVDAGPGKKKVRARVGGARVLPVDALSLATGPDPVVAAAWHPLEEQQIVVLTAAGMLRIYDAAAPHGLGDAILTQSLLGGPLDSTRCADMCFGAALGCHDKLDTCGAMALVRRLTLYVLCENGAVLAIAPFGAVGPKTNELRLLLDAVERDMDQSEGDRAMLERKSSWLRSALRETSSSMVFAPLQIAPPIAPPLARAAPGLSGSAAPAVHGDCSAMSLAVLPTPSSPAVTLLRAWGSGHVDSLLHVVSWVPTPVSSAERPPSFPALPYATPQARRHQLTAHGRVDSPLRNLSAKLTRAVAESGARSPFLDLEPKTEALVDEDPRSPTHGRVPSLLDAQGESTLAVTAAVDRLQAPLPVCTDRPARLVGCTEVARGAKLSLLANEVYPDVVLCADDLSRTIRLLWAPWVARLWDEDEDSPDAALNHLGRLVARVLSDVEAEDMRGVAQLVQPGVGHLLVVRDGPHLAHVDLSSACVQVKAALSSVLRVERERNQRSQLELNDAGSEGEEDLAQVLDEMSHSYGQQLAHLVCVPDKLRAIKLFDPALPPAMSLSICAWLRELADALLYGNNSEQGGTKAGLMQALRRGYEMLQKQRDEQDEVLEMQRQVLQKVDAEVEASRQALEETRDMAKRTIALQESTAEGLEAAADQCAALRPRASAEATQFADFVVKMEKKLSVLRARLYATPEGKRGLGARVEALQAAEQSLPRGSLAGSDKVAPRIAGTEMEQHLQVLQEHTQHLVDLMLDTQERHSGNDASLHGIRARLEKVRAALASVGAAAGSTNDSLVLLVALYSEETKRLGELLGSKQVNRVVIAKPLLSRGYQAARRRDLGLHAVDCPYLVEAPGGVRVHVIVLDEDTQGELDAPSGILRVLAPAAAGEIASLDLNDTLYDSSEPAAASLASGSEGDFARVTPVQHGEAGGALCLTSEHAGVVQACEALRRECAEGTLARAL